jgi:hypothetical protein
MEEERRTHVAPLLATAAIAAALAYPLSIGPVCWWFAKEPAVWDGCVGTRPKVAPRAFWPIGWLAKNGPRPVYDAIYWYVTLRDTAVLLPTEFSGGKLTGPRDWSSMP